MSSIIQAAEQAIELGFAPIRINRRTKLPLERGWQTNSILRDGAIRFTEHDNIGIACGFNGLVVIDSDAGGDDARKRTIDKFGPPFRSISRPDAPERFKFLYRQELPSIPPELLKAAREHQHHANNYIGSAWLTDKQATYKPFKKLLDAFICDNELINTQTFSDGAGLEKYEIKSFGAQVVIPPSIHPSGATFEWEAL